MADKAAEQKAVYASRRRVKGSYGKRLLKRRGELVERSSAHCSATGAMRRFYLRGPREYPQSATEAHIRVFSAANCSPETPAYLHRGSGTLAVSFRRDYSFR